MRIQIDNRECKEVIQAFTDEGIDTEVVTLPIGDFVYENVCIEHKQIADLVQSTFGGHLQKQLLQMSESYPHNFLLITGKVADYVAGGFAPSNFTLNHWVGILASISVRYPNIKVVQVPNFIQMAKITKKLIEKSLDGKKYTYQDTELLRNKVTTDDIKLKILTAFRGVGLKKAKKLIEKKPEISELIDKLIESVTPKKK